MTNTLTHQETLLEKKIEIPKISVSKLTELFIQKKNEFYLCHPWTPAAERYPTISYGESFAHYYKSNTLQASTDFFRRSKIPFSNHMTLHVVATDYWNMDDMISGGIDLIKRKNGLFPGIHGLLLAWYLAENELSSILEKSKHDGDILYALEDRDFLIKNKYLSQVYTSDYFDVPYLTSEPTKNFKLGDDGTIRHGSPNLLFFTVE